MWDSCAGTFLPITIAARGFAFDNYNMSCSNYFLFISRWEGYWIILAPKKRMSCNYNLNNY